MFSLYKCHGDVPGNVSIPAGAQAADVNFKVGMACYYASGKLTPCVTNARAEWIIAEDATVGTSGGNVVAYRVTRDMIFEVPCSTYDSSVAKLGAHVQFGASTNAGLTIVSTAATEVTSSSPLGFGALIVDTLGATANNDYMLVALA